MSFFSMLGLTVIQCSESNHGALESKPKISIKTVNEPLPKEIVVEPPTPQTPQSAISSLTFAANQFAVDKLVVAKGYFVGIADNVPTVASLYLIRKKGPHQLICQVQADEEIQWLPSKYITDEGERTIFHAAIHRVKGPTKYFYLTIPTF